MNSLTKTWIALQLRMEELRKDAAGLSTVEYIIILILIAVVAIGLWRTFGTTVNTKITSATGGVQGL